MITSDQLVGAENEDVSVEYKGKKYQLCGYAQMKCPDTGNWLEAVQYFDGNTSTMYVREKDDFLNKFTIVQEDGVSE